MDCQTHNGAKDAENSQENANLQECSVSLLPNVSVPVEPPHKDVLNSSDVKEEQGKRQDHVDHSDINNFSPMTLLSPKGSHSSETLHEIKIRPLFIKEEAIAEEKLSLKTETTKPLFKCLTCNLQFRNWYVIKKHRRFCRAKTFSNNLIKQTCSPRMYNRLMMKKLINCVKNNPCLYNVNHENFNNTNLKSVIWSNIAAESNFSDGTKARAQWETLKTQFVKITQQNMQNASKSNSNNWQYHKQMEFMMPYIVDQVVHVNFNETCNNRNETTNVKVEVVTEDEANYSNHTQRNVPRSSLSSTQLQNCIKRKRGGDETSQSRPLDLFFLSMCATTKNLPEYVQLQVKKKVFQAVIEAEEIVAVMRNDSENSFTNDEFHDDTFSFLN